MRARTGLTASPAARPGQAAETWSAERLAARLGFWSAVLATVAAIGFPAGLVVSAVLVPQAKWTGDVSAFASSYRPGAMLLTVVPSILIVPGFLGLTVAIHSTADRRYRPFTLLAVVVASLYAATVGINYFLQLSAVRTNLVTGTNLPATAPWVMSDTKGFFWMLEILGYGWQGLAALLLIVAFGRGGTERWIRRLFAAVGVTGLIPLILVPAGLPLTHPVVAIGGLWVVAFPASTWLCAVYFRRKIETG